MPKKLTVNGDEFDLNDKTALEAEIQSSIDDGSMDILVYPDGKDDMVFLQVFCDNAKFSIQYRCREYTLEYFPDTLDTYTAMKLISSFYGGNKDWETMFPWKKEVVKKPIKTRSEFEKKFWSFLSIILGLGAIGFGIYLAYKLIHDLSLLHMPFDSGIKLLVFNALMKIVQLICAGLLIIRASLGKFNLVVERVKNTFNKIVFTGICIPIVWQGLYIVIIRQYHRRGHLIAGNEAIFHGLILSAAGAAGIYYVWILPYIKNIKRENRNKIISE